MKKHFYLLAAGLFTVCIANAQIKKGDILLGGNVNFNTSNVKPDSYASDQTFFAISPSIAKAVKDDLIVGLTLSYAHTRTKGGTPSTISTIDSYGLGVFVRRYKSLGANFALFAEGNLSGAYQQNNSYPDGAPKPPANKGYSINAGFYPGIAYFISRHVQVETGMQNLFYAQYGHSKLGDGADNVKSNSFSLGTGLNKTLDNFVVGIKWII
ncbi:autotransporter domain-containing protein [Flavitalea sp. BT771]|uniref:autotransporter outer membrane beta-barrel domain-containing protein n=1 Tax=Flavitalea sp. BT771 TaxID=3063329 RepID=UPI0026E1342C|nr:outer membrane beta-barrel protein [Flavitalea sp. BT771]MDO6433794.1 autotransporter domain-containing protein [Flavitalea sp. BT771]MDV6222301.1 autotransporter outer membrane beta-barrel domain-containing protein [Flavitalea sp. BT771]